MGSWVNAPVLHEQLTVRGGREAGEAALRPGLRVLVSIKAASQSLQTLCQRGREPGQCLCCSSDAFPTLGFLGAICGLPAAPGSCRPAETAFPSHPAPSLHPQNKHTHCQRATGTCNEKQVSPRDLSAVAGWQLGVTASGPGAGWGHCRAPPGVWLLCRAWGTGAAHAFIPGHCDC